MARFAHIVPIALLLLPACRDEPQVRDERRAVAVQRIPDAHCNGDMHAALEYARKVKHAQKDFLTEQGVKAIY